MMPTRRAALFAALAAAVELCPNPLAVVKPPDHPWQLPQDRDACTCVGMLIADAFNERAALRNLPWN